MHGFILGFSIPVYWLYVYLYAAPHYIDDCSFVVQFEIRKYESSSFVLIFHFFFFFDYSGFLEIPCEFYNECFYFCKIFHWEFDSNCIESIDYLEYIDILIILTLPIQEHEMCFILFMSLFIFFSNVL